MKRTIASICIAAMTAATAGVATPSVSAPFPNMQLGVGSSDVVNAQYRPKNGFSARQDFDGRSRHNSRKRIYRHNGHPYYNGHRGYRHYRPGYREYHGSYFPEAAFAGIVGAIIGGAIANSGPRSSGRIPNAHVNWCRNHYRSYRLSDNSFQPYHGPRQVCRSPYW